MTIVRQDPRAPSAAAHPSAPRARPTLVGLAKVSLWLGLTGFGGGLSVLSLIRNELVVKRPWLTEREFANTVTISQMLPGGASANVLAYAGLRFHRLRGALVGYLGFVLPGFVAVLALAFAYVRYGATPNAELVLSGFNSAVVGLIIAVALKMAATSIARLWQMAIAAAALLLSFVGNAAPAEVVLLGIAGGFVVDLNDRRRVAARRSVRRPKPAVGLPEEGRRLDRAGAPSSGQKDGTRLQAPALVAFGAALLGVAILHSHLAELLRAYFAFFRTGLGAYGGGFAIIPHLKTVMHQTGWLTDKQFADAVAIGKLTPGPVLLLATFIGYVKDGLIGALLATVAIFAGPFGLIVLFGSWLNRVRSRRWVRVALRGLTPAVVGLMAAAAIALGTGFTSNAEIGIAAACALTLARFEVNPVLMLALGGAARIGLQAFGL